jgi:ribosomal protein S18 acetylase RimI-like enzyme
MEIRPLNENDAAKYWNLRLEALGTEPFAFGKAPEEYQAISVEAQAARFREMHPDFTLGAFEGEELIGMATFVREKGRKERHKGRIYGVYITRSQRGKGVGYKLMHALLEKAKEDPSLEQVLLAVGARQESARQLYRKLGFESFGTEPRALKIGSEYIDEEHLILRFR